MDEYCILCDWVELYNTSDAAVDISGYTLSDNAGNDKYAFPQGTVLEGNSYLVVYCTDQIAAANVAPFGLSRNNEESVVLKNASGMIVEIAYSLPMDKGAMALREDGTWTKTEEISAGYSNTAAGHKEFLNDTGTMAGNVRITELMPADQLALLDSYDEFSDWVELYNTTSQSVNLAGWCLSDDPSEPQKWMIPEMVLQPGEYRVIFCSGRGTVESGEVHAEFSLSAAGESLMLTSFAGNVVDTVNFPATEPRMSVTVDADHQILMTDMVTAVVIQVITSNVVLSLGMVGALSIVRFRTAVKDAADTAFLFWSIATGIICGAGYVSIAVLATLLLGALFVLVYLLGKKHKVDSFMVVARFDVDCDAETELAAMPAYKMKNKTMGDDLIELVAEMRLGDKEMEKLSLIQKMPGVREITVMRSVTGSIL